MSERVVQVEYTCDQCGKTEITPPDLPDGWLRFGDWGAWQYHICSPECLRAWLDSHPVSIDVKMQSYLEDKPLKGFLADKLEGKAE